MAVENYVPYKGVFDEESASITATVEWFRDTSELVFLWVFPDGTGVEQDYATALEAANVSVSDTSITVNKLVGASEDFAQCVYIYRKSLATIEAEAKTSGRVPVEAIVQELEEHYRRLDDAAVETSKAIKVPEWDGDTYLPSKDVRAGHVVGFDADGKPAIGRNVKDVDELFKVKEDAQASADAAEASAKASAESAEEAKQAATTAAEEAAEKATTEVKDELKGYVADGKASAEEAKASAEEAKASEKKALSYAASASSYANKAEASKVSAEGSATEAQKWAGESEAYYDKTVEEADSIKEDLNAKIEAETARATAAEDLLAPKASPTLTGTTTAATIKATTLNLTGGATMNTLTATGAAFVGGDLTGGKDADFSGTVTAKYLMITSNTPALPSIDAAGKIGTSAGFSTTDEAENLYAGTSDFYGDTAVHDSTFTVTNTTNGDLFKVGDTGVSVLTFLKSDGTTTNTLSDLDAQVDTNTADIAKKGGYLAGAYSKNTAAVVLYDAYKTPTSDMKQLSTVSLRAASSSNAGVMTATMYDNLTNATTNIATLQTEQTAQADSIGELTTKVSSLESTLTSAMHYKGSVASQSDLPTEGNTVGDFWNVTDTGANYAWDGEAWDTVAGMATVSTATVDAAGVVKLGTATALTTSTGALVGATSGGQLMTVLAGNSSYGAVRLNDVVKATKWRGDGTEWFAFDERNRVLNMRHNSIHGISQLTWDGGTVITFPETSGTFALTSDIDTAKTELTTQVEANTTAIETNATAIETETTRAKSAESVLDKRVEVLENSGGSGGSGSSCIRIGTTEFLGVFCAFCTDEQDTDGNHIFTSTINGSADLFSSVCLSPIPTFFNRCCGFCFETITSAIGMFWTAEKNTKTETLDTIYIAQSDGKSDAIVRADYMFFNSSVPNFIWAYKTKENVFPVVESAAYMFYNAINVENFAGWTGPSTVAFGALTNGTAMFKDANTDSSYSNSTFSLNLKKSTVAFSNLVYAEEMFSGANITSLGLSEENTAAFSKVREGGRMFYNTTVLNQLVYAETDSPKAVFDSAFGELEQGTEMFYNSNIQKLNLKQNSVSFSKLQNGEDMFKGCSNFYGAQEIEMLVNNLPTASSATITLPPQSSVIWDDTTVDKSSSTYGRFETYGGIGDTPGTPLNWETIKSTLSAKGWTAER